MPITVSKHFYESKQTRHCRRHIQTWRRLVAYELRRERRARWLNSHRSPLTRRLVRVVDGGPQIDLDEWNRQADANRAARAPVASLASLLLSPLAILARAFRAKGKGKRS